MGDGMRALKIATVVMGVLIIVGTIGLLVALARRGAAPSASTAAAVTTAPRAPLAVTMREPEGTRIVTVTAVQDRLAVQLQGGGPDRIVLIDPHTGAEVGRIALAH